MTSDYALLSGRDLSQDKRAVERVNIDKVYHPFLTGPYNKLVGEMMQETGARVNVPPPSVNKTEIVITGEKEQVALAVALIKKIYEEKVCGAGLHRIFKSYVPEMVFSQRGTELNVTLPQATKASFRLMLGDTGITAT